MSLYTLTTTRTIQNISPNATDVTTRNEYMSTYVGYFAGYNNAGHKNTFIGYQSGKENLVGEGNVFLGTDAGENNTLGSANTYLGTDAGKYNTIGGENVFIGFQTGLKNQEGTKNVIIGTNAGLHLNGHCNIYLGYNNTAVNQSSQPANNISIGTNGKTLGYNNIGIGSSTFLQHSNTIVIGNSTSDFRGQSILIGNNIRNYGSNNFILLTGCNEFINHKNDYVNINNLIISEKKGDVLFLGNNSQSMTLSNKTLTMNVKSIDVNDDFKLQNRNNMMSLTSNMDIFSSNNIIISNSQSEIMMSSNQVSLKSTTPILLYSDSKICFSNHTSKLCLHPSNIILSSDTSMTSIDKNKYTIFSQPNILIESRSNVCIKNDKNKFCLFNEFVSLSNQHGSLTLDREALNMFHEKKVTLSNAFGSMSIESDVLQIHNKNPVHLISESNIMFSNLSGMVQLQDDSILLSSQEVLIGSMKGVINVTDHEVVVDHSNSINIYALSNITLSNPYAYFSINSNGVTFDTDNNFNIKGGITLRDKSDMTWWKMFVDYNSNGLNDLVFQSYFGSRVTFTDDFALEVLNFTGKHRCKSRRNNINFEKDIGKIVVSCGKYHNLNDTHTIIIDEAVPTIELSRQRYDTRVVGVIGGVDTFGMFRLGNMKFFKNYVGERVIVQSSGEGGIWICNANGNIRNGDLITTSHIPGYGMRQHHQYQANYTVAKITCNCNFYLKSKKYKCETFIFKGKQYRKAFVGCVYNC